MQAFCPVIVLPYLRLPLLCLCLLSLQATTAAGQMEEMGETGPTTDSTGAESPAFSLQRQRADHYFALAATHFDRGEFAQAAVNARLAFQTLYLPQYRLGYGRAMYRLGCTAEAIDAFADFLSSGSGTPSRNDDTRRLLASLRAQGPTVDPEECASLAVGKLPAAKVPAITVGVPGVKPADSAARPDESAGDGPHRAQSAPVGWMVGFGALALVTGVGGYFVLDTGLSSFARARAYRRERLSPACADGGLCSGEEQAAVESYNQKFRKGGWHTAGGVALFAASAASATAVLLLWSNADDDERAAVDVNVGLGVVTFRTTF